jgi:hypothetical protein
MVGHFYVLTHNGIYVEIHPAIPTLEFWEAFWLGGDLFWHWFNWHFPLVGYVLSMVAGFIASIWMRVAID